MKKHLLFSRVNPDGRTTVERRSNDGQSKGRYSVGLAKLLFTITLLLTLGVGQMWALDIYLDITAANWPADGATIKLYPGTGSDITGTSVATNLYKFTVTSATGTMWFKRMSGSSTWNQGSVTYNSSYNLYKLTGWDAAACSNANVSTATKTNYIYFDNSVTNWSNSYKYFVIGHDYPSAYSKVYSMSALGHTKLWYVSQSSDSWTDLTYYAICSPTSSWSGTSWGSSNISNANKYAAPYKGKYDMNNGSSYLFTPANSSNNCALTISYIDGGYSKLNYSQTVKKYTSTDGGSTYSAASINSGTVTITPYKLTGNGTVSNSSNTGTLDEASETSVSKDAVYTGEVTVTASANTGYTFVGWFTAASGGSAVSTDASYTYNAPKSTKTIYARFKENRHDIKVLTASPSAGGSSPTPSSWKTTGQITGGSISITKNTGYNFSGWTISSGSGTFADASSLSTTFYPTADSELRPNFTAKTYTVTLDKNGGSSDGSATATFNSNTLTDITAPTRASYDVEGYYTEGGTKVVNADGSLVSGTVSGFTTSGYWTKDGDATLYAHWTYNPITYTVNFGYRTGQSSYGSVTAQNTSTEPATDLSNGGSVEVGSTIVVTATPNDDYKLEGWYNAASGGSLIAGAGTTNPYSYTLSGNTKTYASFVQKTTTVTLKKNDGTSASTEITATHGSTLPSFTVHSRSGYTLKGYYTNSSGGTKIINADKSLVANVTDYTTSASKWDYDDASLTLYAQYTENLTTVTVNVSPASTGTLTLDAAAFTPGNTTTAGVTTSHSVVATAANDYAFSSWSVTGNATGTSSTNTYTLKGNGSGSTGTLTANFTLIPCKLYKVSAAKNGSTTDKGAMSYDATEHAYYKDITTDASPYYFRFYYNSSAQYCTDWKDKYEGGYTSGKHVSANDSKVACDQSVGGWGDKPAMYYSGASGTTIRIWFDYQNKKVWITADKDKQYVLRGSKYDESGNGGLPGWSATDSYLVGLASGNTGTITETLNASTKYKIKLYDLYSPDWMGNTSTSSETTMSDGTLYTMYSGDSYKNFVFTTTIAGTYTFTLDKSSGKKIKVDYPVSYQLNYAIGDVVGTNGSISTDPSTTSGTHFPNGTEITLTAPAAKTGYEWSGWFTNAAGTEGQIADENRVITITMTKDTTLYACYTENEYNVAVSAGANGSVSPSGTVKIKQVSGTTLTATPSAGYHFDHWAISGGGITPSPSTTSPQTFMATETGGTIQAIFAETTYSVNVNSGNTDFGSVSTSSVSGIGIATYSDEITATPETGATFTGWTLPSGVTAAAGYDASSNPIRIHASASGKTITANFSETKHTATITTEDDDYGTVSPTSASVGQITAVQITASKKTGYMFAGWVQTAGSGTVTYHVAAGAGSSVDATGSTQSITYITIDGNVTLQATWEEDRSAGWFLRGTWSGGWTTGGQKAFIKNEGETAGTVSYVRWTLAPEMFTDATMQMKMYDGSTYYGHSTDFDAAGNLCTKDNNNSNITFYSGVAYQNFKVSIPVAGEYIFRWDSSTKQLTITYPAGNFIRGTFDDWSWNHVLEPTGNANEYSCVISMTGDKAPHAWTGSDGFKVVLAGDHYGKNSSGVTRASRSVSSLKSDGANINWTTDVRGDYTFTVNSFSKTVTVTYPNAYTVTYGYGTGGSSVSASATSVGGTFSSGAYVAAGDDITFTQTAVDGNTFNGWYTTADGNAEVPTMGKSDNVLNSLGGNATVYAQYIPTTYTDVTLNKTVGESNGAYSVTFGGTSITITTAPLKTGYEPEGYYESYADGVWTNKIADSNGALRNGTTYTDASGHWKSTASPTLYTKWQPKTYTITLDKNGSSAGYLENGSVTATYDSNTLSPVTAPTRTGYHIIDGYYKEPGLTNKIINADGTLCASTDYTDASGNWTNDGAVTLYAKWAPNIYTITFAPAGGTVEPASASVTFDAAISDAPVPTRTGYTFTGYNTAGGASITTDGGVFKSSVAEFTDGSAHWIQPDDATITAQWSPNPYTITLTQSTETGYGSAGTAFVTATYDAALPTIASLPTAANGYAFMGYFTGHNGEGTQYYGADGTKVLASYTVADALELFAYFKKAEITDITFSPATVVAHESEVTVTATISPTPTGETTICWRVLHSNDNELETPVTFTPATAQGNSVKFESPAASGMYKVEAVLHLGGGCEGTTLDSVLYNFQVAGDHEVTVQYKDASGNTLQASGTVTGKPLEWSAEAITAPSIFGYTFHHWAAGDGVTLSKDGISALGKDTAEAASIYIKAIYDGKLTAVYNQNGMIYFKNTLGWSGVYVNFYSSDYWDSDKGSGNENLTIRNRRMTRIGETDVWYFDYGALGITPSQYVSFTEYSHDDTNGVKYFWKKTVDGGANVVYPARRGNDLADKANALGFYAKTPMFVPLATQPAVVKNNYDSGKANYYNDGYWTKYTAGTGYTLELYYDSDGSSCIQSVPFTSADELMPMQAVLDLEANAHYRFQLKRDGDVYYGNPSEMTYTDHGQGTAWEMTPDAKRDNKFAMCRIHTNASGNYTFNLSYSGNSATPVYYCLRIEVDYPVASGDYRLLYKDDVHTKWHPSAVIPRVNAKDTVSFFVRTGKHVYLKLQKCTGLGNGTVTWTDTTTWWNNGSGIHAAVTQDSVYNICLTHNASTNKLEIENVEAYTGNFYIRSDAAGGSKWDNFRSADHLMTYSEYSEKNAGYSHYFMSHLYGGSSVKFVVANDYSLCISDTLVRQAGDINHVTEDGKLWTNDSTEANIRFMWNRHDNSVGRAYLAAAKSDGTKFLVLRANSSSDLMDANGNPLRNSANSGQAGYNHKAPDNSMQFIDDENWIYETTVKVRPNAFVKLYARYHGADFYYKGKNNNTFDESNAIQILGGSGDSEKIRVIYDFKTDRLVSAWMPSGKINDEREIHADVMFIREHQGDIEQLTLKSGEGAIKEINTAYGVLRFNKWTMNNKSKAEGHSPLASPASVYERSLYWISFPFYVKLNEVFGFGSYMTHWGVQKYDGADRAARGHFLENGSFWKWMGRNEVLEPNQGYLLSVDVDLLGEGSSVWDNGVENIELFFPSYGAMPDITSADVTQTIPDHECKINRAATEGLPETSDPRTSYNRTIFDSHWNVLSVPTYVNTDDVSFVNPTWIAKVGPKFLYTWNPDDNTITATTARGYTYHAMHAYMVQYAGSITWSASSGSSYPAGIVARKTYEEAPKEVELRLELQQNDKMIDRTYVVISNDEEVSANFAFGEDMTKEFNKNKAAIFNYTADHVGVAGNTMPMSEQTTVIPVGVDIPQDGDYTFAIPSGTNGVGVTLIDTETGVRTSLSALDYTINLSAGTYDSRFVLEISPIQQISTDIENSEISNQNSDVRKVMIDQIMYIIKDGKMYDARGARVQ